MKRLILGILMISFLSIEVCADSKYEIFVDNSTKLIWQDNSDAKTVRKQWITDANKKAKNYMNTKGDTATNYCKNLKFANSNDWRLPIKKELEDLYTKKSKLKNISSNFPYWSSTSLEEYKDLAWVGDDDGMHRGLKSYYLYVRCVRAGQ